MFAIQLRFSLVWAAIGMALANNCPTPKMIENSHYRIEKNVVTYHCDGGFKSENMKRDFNCKKSSWETIKFTCKKTCGTPPDIPNAEIIHSEEESVIYKCLTNFSSSSEPSTNLDIKLKCDGNLWEKPKIQCPEESMPVANISTSINENGTLDEMDATIVQESAVFCNDSNDGITSCKLRKEPNDSSLCIGGFISGTNVSCTYHNTESCPEPINITNSMIQWDSEDYIIYACQPGYVQVGINSTSFCENGTWTEPNIICFPENFGNCSEPVDIPNSLIHWNNGGYLVYTCQPGYNQVGNISASFCENGTWTEINMTCLPENFGNCSEPVDIPNSLIHWNNGGYLVYTCQPGYNQVGNISASFCENGTWTEINMTCLPEIIEVCGQPPSVTGSIVSYDGNTAYFTCEAGFILEGDVTLSICENGTWSEINTTCISKEEYRQRQESKEFQYKLERSSRLICSFMDNEQFCRCRTKFVKMSITSNQKIAKHNFVSLSAESLAECEIFCLRNESCLSLEFKESSKICQLSKTAKYLVENIIVMEAKGVTYGEKVCTDDVMDVGTSEVNESFDLTALSPSALLCSISPEEIFCGCANGRVSSKIYPNKKIAKHNMLSFSTDDPKKCSERCQATQNCLSAEYKDFRKLCHLSQTAHYLADERIFFYSPKTLYFEKKCVPFDNLYGESD